MTVQIRSAAIPSNNHLGSRMVSRMALYWGSWQYVSRHGFGHIAFLNTSWGLVYRLMIRTMILCYQDTISYRVLMASEDWWGKPQRSRNVLVDVSTQCVHYFAAFYYYHTIHHLREDSTELHSLRSRPIYQFKDVIIVTASIIEISSLSDKRVSSFQTICDY